MTDRYMRPEFVAKVRAFGEQVGDLELFERWLRGAQRGHVYYISSLKDYGLTPETIDEHREKLKEYKTILDWVNRNKSKPTSS